MPLLLQDNNESVACLAIDKILLFYILQTGFSNFFLNSDSVIVIAEQVDAIPPAMFLEAAANVNDAQKLASVFRFCLDFVPGFQQSPDFKLYSSHLNQQCTVGNGDS